MENVAIDLGRPNSVMCERDADALFEANRLGIFRRAHRRSDPQRRVIAQQGVRGALVRTRTRWINVVRARLRREGQNP